MVRNRVVFLFMVLFSLGSLGVSGSKGAYVMIVSLGILAFISLSIMVITYFKLKINQTLESSYIIKSDTAYYSLEIRCGIPSVCSVIPHFIPPSPYISYEPLTEPFQLVYNKESRFVCQIDSKYRGICYVGIDYVKIYGFLKLFYLKKRTEGGLKLTVCPKIVPFYDEMFLTSLSEQSGLSKRTEIEDYANITDIRPYVYGDTMKRVHWKLSAVKEQLLVKNYDSANTTVAAIIVDNRKTPNNKAQKEALEDMLMERAVAIVKHNLSSNRPVVVDYMTEEPKRIYEISGDGFDRVYYDMCEMEFNALRIEDLFQDYYNPKFNISAIYLLSINPDGNVVSFAKTMALNGHNMSLEHFFASGDNCMADSLDNSGVRYYSYCLGTA